MEQQMLILNRHNKPIGKKTVYINRDFMCYVDELDEELRELVLVRPISQEEYQLRNEGA